MLIVHRIIIPFGIVTWLLVLSTVLTGLRIIKVHFKWHKRIGIIAIILATIHASLVLSTQISRLSTQPSNDEIEITTIEENVNEISMDGITFRWEVDTTALLHVRVRAPTTGWIAVGFDPIAGMKNANIIIGYVKNDSVFIRDDYGKTPSSHEADENADGTDDVTNKDGSEVDGKTDISFSIPLDSGDARDRILKPGKSYTVLLAYGSDTADDFTSYHKKRLALDIAIE